MTTTALVAAGLVTAVGTANAQLKLSLGGSQEFILGGADLNSAVRKTTGFDVQHDGEIHFRASQTLDNGLRIRTRVELESSQAGDQIDEAYVSVSGKWGEIRAGSEDNAANLMTTPTSGSWATNVGQNLNFDVRDWIVTPAGHALNGTTRLAVRDGDAEKVTYFTPRVSGFQAGVSYMPSNEEDANGSISVTTSGIQHGFATAMNYRGKLGGAGVALAAGYASAKASPNATAVAEQPQDPKGWIANGSIRMSGVTVAASYLNLKNFQTDGAFESGGTNIDLGAKYDFGKNHVSVGYMHNETEATRATSANDKSDRLLVSYRRDLARGVQYRLNFMWADFKGEAAGAADDNEGIAVTTGVRVAF